MTLSMARVGAKNRIKAVWGRRELKNHLATLGFTVNSEVSVISKARGNVIVSVKNARLAISQELANNIMV